VNSSAADVDEVPPDVVTVISTTPGASDGDTAVIDEDELIVNEVASVVPNRTAVAPVKLVPVIVTDVPPATGPLVGEMLVTVGGGVGAT
jgi:hypothetical protein